MVWRAEKHSALKLLCSSEGTPLHLTHRVVEAWARMLPPIGFLGSAENMAAPSTWATTWLVITTATPNYCQKIERSQTKRSLHCTLQTAGVLTHTCTVCVVVFLWHTSPVYTLTSGLSFPGWKTHIKVDKVSMCGFEVWSTFCSYYGQMMNAGSCWGDWSF